MFSSINFTLSNFWVFLTQSFWRDEAFTVLMMRNSYQDILQLTANDFNPPLYYFLIKFYSQIFGEGEISLRLFSILCFGLLIILIGKYLYLKKVKLFLITISLFISISSPHLFYLGFEARMYALFALLTGLILFYYDSLTPRIILLITTITLLTHYYSIFFIGTYFLYNIVHKKHANVKAILIGGLIASPWYVFAIPQVIVNSGNFWISYSTWSDLILLPSLIWGGYEPIWQYFDNHVSALSGLILIATILSHQNFQEFFQNLKSKFEYWIIFIALPLIFFISFFKPLIVARYLIFVNVAWLKILLDRLCFSKYKLQQILIILLLVSINMVFLFSSLEFKHKTPWAKISQTLKNSVSENDLVYTKNAGEYFSLCYYMDCKQIKILELKSNVPHFVGTALIPDSAFYDPNLPLKGFIIDNNNNYYQVNP